MKKCQWMIDLHGTRCDKPAEYYHTVTLQYLCADHAGMTQEMKPWLKKIGCEHGIPLEKPGGGK